LVFHFIGIYMAQENISAPLGESALADVPGSIPFFPTLSLARSTYPFEKVEASAVTVDKTRAASARPGASQKHTGYFSMYPPPPEAHMVQLHGTFFKQGTPEYAQSMADAFVTQDQYKALKAKWAAEKTDKAKEAHAMPAHDGAATSKAVASPKTDNAPAGILKHEIPLRNNNAHGRIASLKVESARTSDHAKTSAENHAVADQGGTFFKSVPASVAPSTRAKPAVQNQHRHSLNPGL
jgi:hypothetical protein